MDALPEGISPNLKGFLINMIKETMYAAGYDLKQVMEHIAETEPYLDSLNKDEVSLKLLHELSDSAYHHC